MTISKEAIDAGIAAANERYLDFMIEDETAFDQAVEAGIRSALSTLPIAGEVPEGWQLVPIVATLEMEHAAVARVKPFHDEDWYRIMPKDLFRLAWKALLEAAPVPPSSPGKDGGQEVEAVAIVTAYREIECTATIRFLRLGLNGKSPVGIGDKLYTRPQPASTALVERLERERDYAVRWANKAVADVKEHDDAIIQKLKLALETINGSEGLLATELRAIARATLSASSREGESRG